MRLPTLLISVNVALVLAAIVGIALVATGLLQGFADDQGQERVAQTVSIAQKEIVGSRGKVVANAQLLAQRPTLARLVAADDRAGLELFLEQFRATSALDGVRVVRGGAVVVEIARAPLPATAALSHSAALLDGPELLIAATQRVTTLSDTEVLVWIDLDAAYQEDLGRTLGLPVMILSRQRLNTGAADPLRAASLAGAEVRVASRDEVGQYVAVAPLDDGGGRIVGVVEVSLPADRLVSTVRRLITTLLSLALGVALVAALINLLVGRHLGTPLQTLTRAAARIGHGDLATPVPLAQGAEIGTLATTLEDMRARLGQLTTDLRRQQAEANAILTGIIEGVFTVDRDRRIRYLNPQAAAIVGLAPAQIVGRFCGDVLRPQEVNGVRPCEEHCPIIHARFRGGARATEHLLLADGSQRTVVITSSGIADQGQVQVIRDETEIEASRRLRDTILATISHEFRTPLSAQLASLELLLDQLPELTTNQIQQLVVSLQRGTLRLTYLIDNLLESARIEAGQLDIRRQTVALDAVVDDALELMRPLLDQREQRISLDLPYPLPPIQGDATRLVQVFVNLLANASKFAPAGSTIALGGVVEAAPLGATVTLWVDDEGPGLPSAEVDTLFRRFLRAAEPEQSGVGLGLWIVQSIVERHGGQIAAHSRPEEPEGMPGRAGTRIAVTLPGAADETVGR